MYTVNLIAKGIPENERAKLPTEPIQNICCVTGETTFCIPRKELLKSSFTNLDILIAPQSNFVGINAFYSLKYNPERQRSWYVDERELQILYRPDVREKVIAGTYGRSWSGYATTSNKKHGSLFTKVNSGCQVIWRFEMKNVDCSDHQQLMSIWTRLNLELRVGIVRPVLESLRCSSFLIGEIGIKRWLTFKEWAGPLYQGNLYQFLCYLLPSQQELKDE